MNNELKFTVSDGFDDEGDQEVKRGTFSRNWKSEDELDELLDQIELGEITEIEALEKASPHLKANPNHLEWYNFVANRLWDLELRDQAAEVWEQAYKLGCSKIPKGFKGVISWYEIDNRPFLRCVHGYILGLLHIKKYKEALTLARKMLRWNKDDNLGVRYLVPDLQFATGDMDSAMKSYLQSAEEQPTLWYNAALIAYRQDRFVEACTYVRRGIAGNPYVAEALTGRTVINDHLYWHGSNLHGTDFALDYINAPVMFWQDEETDFVDWVFNCSHVLKERADLMECHEGLTYEHDPKSRRPLVDKWQGLISGIDDTLSEKLVRKVNSRLGNEVWPWDRQGLHR